MQRNHCWRLLFGEIIACTPCVVVAGADLTQAPVASPVPPSLPVMVSFQSSFLTCSCVQAKPPLVSSPTSLLPQVCERSGPIYVLSQTPALLPPSQSPPVVTEDIIARIRAEAEAKVRAEIEAKAKEDVAKAMQVAEKAQKDKEEAERRAAELEAAAAAKESKARNDICFCSNLCHRRRARLKRLSK